MAATDDVVEVVDMDDEAPDVEGYLEMAPVDKKKPEWKPLYFLLHGSSLFYYKNELEAKAKGVIQLSGVSVELVQGSEVVVVRDAKKGGWQLKAGKAEKAQWWATQLTAARDRKPREMPDRDRLATEAKSTSKRSVAYRAMKTFGSKFAGSRLGQSTFSAMSELADKLNKAFEVVVFAESGSKEKASWVSTGLAKIIIKFYIEVDRGTITSEQIKSVDKFTRASFLLFEKLFKNYKRVPAEQMRDMFLENEHMLTEFNHRMAELIRPYVRAKTMLLLHNLGEYLDAASFWMRVWSLPDPDGKVEAALFDLVSAMVKYTQVEMAA